MLKDTFPLCLQGLLVCALLVIGCACVACNRGAIAAPDQLGANPHIDRAQAAITPSPLPTIIPLSTSGTIPLTETPHPTLILPTLTPYPDDIRFSLGKSWEGRDIWAWQLGDGSRTIVLVGGIHGGFEGNTVMLAEQLVDHFRRNPAEILQGIRLIIIPLANPDGLARGSGLEGRFNARGVDLNRNWGCEWSDRAYLRDIEVNPGPRPFSESEALALRAYFVAEPPDAVIFYHSSAAGVFLGSCGGKSPGKVWMGNLLAKATDYTYHTFSYYEISGDAANWLAERGIPAAVVELASRDDPEFARNLAGVIALQCRFALADATSLSSPDPAVNRLCP